MNDVGGSESGRGLRAVKSSRTSDSNFEYDDSEWDVGIGNLIIDLDADIEKTNEATRSGSSNSSSTPSLSSLTRSLPASTNSPNSQMHIPPSSNSSSTSANNSTKGKSSAGAAGSSALPLPPSAAAPVKTPAHTSLEPASSGNSVISVSMEQTMSDKGLKMKIKRSKPGTKSVDAKHEIVKSDVLALAASASGSSNTSLTKTLSNSNVSDSKNLSSNSSSQKDGKETKMAGGQEKESTSDSGNQNDQNSAKAKAAKRTTSTHKKIKLATGVTASIVSTSKKEVNASETKTLASTNLTTAIAPINSSLGNSHSKDIFSSNPITLTGLGNASAFVKTSAGSNIKIPSQGSILAAHDLGSGNSGTGISTNCRSLHNNSTIHSSSSPHIQLTSGAPVKVDKSGITSSVTNTPPEKGPTSNLSYGKKSRVAAFPSEKSSGQEISNAQIGLPLGNAVGVLAPLAYRNTVSHSGSDVVTTPATGPPLTGNVNSLGSGAKESVPIINSRVPVQQQISFQDACVGTTVGTVTEPDCLGPCEPGTSVTLEGIVWHETENGVLVVNVTWRGKTYVGTLLDCTKNDWASPRFCDSPTSDLEMRTPKNRGKRGRAQTATPVSDPGVVDVTKPSSTKLRNGAKGRRGSATSAAFVAPVSPLKPDQWPKRKTRGSETESQEEFSCGTNKSTKRLKLNKDSSGRQAGSPAPLGALENSGIGPFSPALIECPEPNCSKKYKHINGLRYHQSHAHSSNFVAEDSDSNMSTASNTNIHSVVESSGPNDEVPVEARLDVDAIEGSAESISAPTTPVKKQKAKSEADEKEKSYELELDSEVKSNIGRDSDLKVALSSKLLSGVITKTPEKEDTEKLSEKNEIQSGSKEKENPITGISSRTPILTVPTLPFMSLQNRTQLFSTPLHRMGNSESSEKPNRDQEAIAMSKIGSNSSPAAPTSKGIPWQPHAISSFHSSQSQNLNIPVTLNVPMGSSITSRDHDKSNKEFKSSSSISSSKKPKHKKKSKEKSEKDRERDREKLKLSSSDYTNRDNIKQGVFSPNSGIQGMIQKEKERDERRSGKGEEVPPRRDSDSGGGHLENREDPQSPAYSDISDANDSGPESDLNLGGKEPGGKHSVPEVKKDGSGGQGMSSFYSPFYTPMESPYLGSSNSTAHVKVERNSSGGSGGMIVGTGSGGDDQSVEKLKSKSSLPLPQHISAHMEERRSSPKLDYHHSNYLPPQQHYFSYSYPNYHYDQPFGLLPDKSYGHNNRAIVEEKERETEESQRVRVNSKSRTSDSLKDELTPTNLSSITIKQEPGVDRGNSKEHPHRPSSASSAFNDKGSHALDTKPDFSNEYQESKRHGALGISHYSHTTCSKHSKESRRDREERHGKEAESKDAGRIGSRSLSQEHSSRQKGMDTNNERNIDKESKNEGAKPTMETQGPPPPPTAGSYAYYPPGYLQGNPYSIPFDPNHHLFRHIPYPGSPYMHPHPGGIPRFSQPSASTPLPEDLSRSNPAPPPKALDLLQHHAAQYYASHKIHELQERALKSPSPQINQNRESGGGGLSGPTNLSSTPASPSSGLSSQGRGGSGSGNMSTERKQPADLTKDIKPLMNPLSGSGPGTESSRSPPIHHVHTHMHSHTHIGYPIIPTVPPQYSPNLTHYGVMTTPAAAPPASVIPPFPSQKPT